MKDTCRIRGLALILTAQCNLRCSYCYQNAKRALTMDRATLAAALDLALNSPAPVERLLFLGGEPLLAWPDIRWAVACAARILPPREKTRFEINTNGLLLTDRIADFLDEHGFEVQLSFDGIAAAQDYRQQETFLILDRLLDRLSRRNRCLFEHKLRVSSTLIPATIPFLADSVRYFLQKGIRSIGINPSLGPVMGWNRDAAQSLDHQFLRIYQDSLRHFKKTGDIPLQLFRRRAEHGAPAAQSRAMCSVGSGEMLTVDVDGQVYGCAVFAESYQDFSGLPLKDQLAPFRMGDVRHPQFRKRHAAFRRTAGKVEILIEKERKYSRHGQCRECTYLDQCTVCPASIVKDPDNSDPLRIPDFLCGFNKTALEFRNRFPIVPDPIEVFEALLQTKKQVQM